MKTPNRVLRKISQMRAKCGNVEEKYSLFSMVLSGQCYTGGLSVGHVLSATGGKSKASKQRTAGLNQHLLPHLSQCTNHIMESMSSALK